IKSKILFCCPNEVVLLEVAHMVFGTGIPFGIVTYCQTENTGKKAENKGHLPNVKKLGPSLLKEFGYDLQGQREYALKYSWSACIMNDPDAKEKCILYLCDMFAARHLLEERAEQVRNLNLCMEAHRRDPKNYPITESRLPVVQDYSLVLLSNLVFL
ncbi:MAG: hypothetical protein Satyrvirus26_12, partial [Satyrvirus sp.]